MGRFYHFFYYQSNIINREYKSLGFKLKKKKSKKTKKKKKNNQELDVELKKNYLPNYFQKRKSFYVLFCLTYPDYTES